MWYDVSLVRPCGILMTSMWHVLFAKSAKFDGKNMEILKTFFKM